VIFINIMEEKKDFNCDCSGYFQVANRNHRTFDLYDDINKETFPANSYHSKIRLRKAANDDIDIIDTHIFLNWCKKNQYYSNPLTRENLNYLEEKFIYKQWCFAKFPNISYDKAYTYNFRHSIINFMINGKNPDLCRAFFDLSMADEFGMIHNTNYDKTVELLSCRHGFLMRKSRIHGVTLPNSDIIVIGMKLNDEIIQLRYIYIHGVGWYVYNNKIERSVNKIKKKKKKEKKNIGFTDILNELEKQKHTRSPDFVCLFDLLRTTGVYCNGLNKDLIFRGVL
jgi:hypothetical protein